MRKALLPMIASLVLCGTATVALIATNASADQGGRRPVMIAQAAPGTNAGPDAGPSPEMRRAMTAHRQQLCKDLYAHKVGELAFLEAKLSLTASQAPLFARWKEVSLDIAKRHQTMCESPQPEDMHQDEGLVDRLTREEELLKTRLADIQAERPSLTAFYASLTPAQKEEFDRGDQRRLAGRMHMMLGMMGRPHPSEMAGPMMGHGPASGSAGDMPPPPPPPPQ